MEEQSSLALIMIVLGSAGGGLGIIWILLVFYLKSKWLILLEDTLDDGVRFYSLNVFFAGQGILQYASIFLSKFHAKRYGMLEKRKKIPLHVQRLFIFAFCCCLLSLTFIAASAIMIERYDL